MSSRSNTHTGFVFEPFKPENQSPFDKLFEIFKELITFTSGDFDETINWMRELDKEYNLTNDDYTIDDFVEDLKKKGYIKQKIDPKGTTETTLSAKTEQALRKKALDQIFGKLFLSG